jgi:hypothetical protein
MKAAMLIVPLAVSLLMGPLAAEAQPRGNLPRVGVLDPGSPQHATIGSRTTTCPAGVWFD